MRLASVISADLPSSNAGARRRNDTPRRKKKRSFRFPRAACRSILVGRNRNLGLRLAGLVGHQEAVADSIADRIEKARAAMDMPPALVDEPLRVRTDEQELFKI